MALEAREIDDVEVHEPDRPDARRGQIDRQRAPEPARADDRTSRPAVCAALDPDPGRIRWRL
jgi:hypothetical protein